MTETTRPMSETAQGVRDAFGFWLSQHPLTMQEIFEEVLAAVFKQWLEAHTLEIIEALRKGPKEEAP